MLGVYCVGLFISRSLLPPSVHLFTAGRTELRKKNYFYIFVTSVLSLLAACLHLPSKVLCLKRIGLVSTRLAPSRLFSSSHSPVIPLFNVALFFPYRSFSHFFFSLSLLFIPFSSLHSTTPLIPSFTHLFLFFFFYLFLSLFTTPS